MQKVSHFMTLGVLDGESIPAEALDDPTLVSVQAMEFLEFCDDVAEGWIK